MLTNALPTLTRPMYTSRLAFSSCKMGKRLPARPTKAMLLSRKMCTLRLTSLPPSMGLLHHSGVLLNHSNPLKVQLHPPWQVLDGIDLLLKSAIPIFLPSS